MTTYEKLLRTAYKVTDMTRKKFGAMKDLIELRRACKSFEKANKKRGKG